MSISGKQLFQAEFGQYMQSVSDDNRIGVCSKCLTVRSRDEVDPQERCPADLVRAGMDEINRAAQHEWVGFTESSKLESFLKEHFPRFKQLAAEAADMVQMEESDEDSVE